MIRYFILLVLLSLLVAVTTVFAKGPNKDSNTKTIKKINSNMKCKHIGIQKIKGFKFSKRKLKKIAIEQQRKEAEYAPMPKFRSTKHSYYERKSRK